MEPEKEPSIDYSPVLKGSSSGSSSVFRSGTAFGAPMCWAMTLCHGSWGPGRCDSRFLLFVFGSFPRAPSMQILPTFGPKSPKVCKIMAFKAIFGGFGAVILHTLGVQEEVGRTWGSLEHRAC